MLKNIMSMALLCIASSAAADGNWTVGVLGAGATGIYVGEDDAFGFVPILSYDTEKFHIGVDGLSYQIYDYGLGQIDVSLGYRQAPEFPDKEPLFDGLKREDTLELGIGTQLEFGDVYFGLNALADIADEHGGTEADITLGYVIVAGGFQIDAAVGATFRDKKLNQYLYGVSAAEATAGRSAFQAQDTTTAFANLTVAYAITDNITALAQIGYEDLGQNSDSPLVRKSSSNGFGVGLAWSF